MSNMWQKIVSMVRKTGDRCLIFDSQTEDAYVVMDFGSYERILECDSDIKDSGCCGGGAHETRGAEIPESATITKTVSIQPEKSVPEFAARPNPIVVSPPSSGARLTQKTIPDTINPDFDVPLPDISETDEDISLESLADLSGESVGISSHFYLEPLE